MPTNATWQIDAARGIEPSQAKPTTNSPIVLAVGIALCGIAGWATIEGIIGLAQWGTACLG